MLILRAPRQLLSFPFGTKSRPDRVRRKSDRVRDARNGLAWTLATLVLIHAITWYLVEQSPKYRDPFFADRVRLLERQLRKAGPANELVLVCGSSRVANGLNGRATEDRLRESGRSCTVFNFGFGGAGPGTLGLYLERLRDEEFSPNVIAIELFPVALMGFDAEPVFPEIHCFRDGRFDLEEMQRALQRQLIPESDPTPIDDPAFTFLPFRREMCRRCLPRWFSHAQHVAASHPQTDSGWIPDGDENPSPERRSRAWNLAQSAYERVLSGGCLQPKLVANLRETIRIARERCPNVVLIRMPEGPRFQLLYSESAKRQLADLVEELRREERIETIDARNWVREEEFVDSHHMTCKGANLFSTSLADALLETGLIRKP